jgi:hypothetical protein
LPRPARPARLHRIRISGRIDRPRRVYRGRVDLDPAGRRTAAHEGRAAQVLNLADRLSRGETTRDLADLPFRVAIDEQIRLRVEQH